MGNSVRPQLLTMPRPPSSRADDLVDPARLGRAATDARRAAVGNSGSSPCCALRGEVGLEERQRGAEERGTLLGHEERECARRRTPRPAAGGSPTCSAAASMAAPPMCVHGEADRVDVVGRRLDPGDERVHARDDRRVGVPRALGVGGRSGRVVQPAPDPLGLGRRRQRRRIAGGQRVARRGRCTRSRPRSRRASAP